jgi:hypothetical protein
MSDFKLDPCEIGRSRFGSNSGLRRKATRSGRANTLTSATVTLTHMPTGVSVSRDIPTGNRFRGELKRLQNQLEAELLVLLTAAVAKKLRIPGL